MGIKDCAESPRCILVEAKEQETAWVLRWMTLLDEVPTKLHQVLQLSECWLLLSLLRAVVCKMGSFLLMRPLGTLIQVPRENFKVRGSCPEKKKHRKKRYPCAPRIVVPIASILRNFLLSSGYKMSQVYPLCHIRAYIVRRRIVWVDEKKNEVMRYQHLSWGI